MRSTGKRIGAVAAAWLALLPASGCSSDRSDCPLLDGTVRDVGLRDFTVGPIDELIAPSEPTSVRKLWWSPLSRDVRAETIRVEVEGSDDYHQVYVQNSATAGADGFFYPGSVELPTPGEYRISAIAGNAQGCFRIIAIR